MWSHSFLLAESTLISHTVFRASTLTPINVMSTLFMGPWIRKGVLVVSFVWSRLVGDRVDAMHAVMQGGSKDLHFSCHAWAQMLSNFKVILGPFPWWVDYCIHEGQDLTYSTAIWPHPSQLGCEGFVRGIISWRFKITVYKIKIKETLSEMVLSCSARFCCMRTNTSPFMIYLLPHA